MRKGFTLIELLIASSVFVTAVTIAFSALLSAQAAFTRVDGLRSVMDGLNASVELMSREIRYGSVYFCGTVTTLPASQYRTSCPLATSTPSGGTALVFKPVTALTPTDRIGYFMTGGKVYKYSYLSGFESVPQQLTGDDIEVTHLRFFVRGANTTEAAVIAGNVENDDDNNVDIEQPTVTLVIAGKTKSTEKTADQIPFEIQTTITQRKLDL